jgi:hypothetical protein
MSQHYSDETRADKTYALPDVETFFHQHAKRERGMLNAGEKARQYGECLVDDDGECLGTGWYFQFCFPGCLPESDPYGPYATEALAIDAMHEQCDN